MSNMTWEQENERLKRCPYCGQKAMIVKKTYDRVYDFYEITCRGENCLATITCNDKETAILRWNLRAEYEKKKQEQKEQEQEEREYNTERRLYISGAVTGTQDAEERFKQAEEEYTAAGYTVINPQKMCATLPELKHEEYMKLCFTLLDMCDYFYQIPGWKNSRGANQEYGYALATDKTFI